MKYREESLIDLRYNLYIIILSIILVILLASNGLVMDKFTEINRKIFRMGSDTHYQIIVHELPVTESYTKPGNKEHTIIKDAFRYILGLFGCKDDNPVSVLVAEHPMFLPYDQMNVYRPKTDDYELNIHVEQKAGEVDEISLPGNDKKPITSGIHASTDHEPRTGSISTENGVHDPYDFNNIKYINETGFNINKIIHDLYEHPYPFEFDRASSNIIIYHTHTTESFVSQTSDIYNSEIYTRSNEPSENICKVGDELYRSLTVDYGFNVIHDTTVHDYPVFNNAYSNSYKTISGLIKSNQNTGIVIDVHRNALDRDVKLRLPYETEFGTAAKISFVVATGEIGLPHENWKQNLQIALRLTNILEKLYPGITEPVYISKYRYNQHVSTGALLVEIGAEGNLLEECELSGKILAKAIYMMLS